MSSVVVVDYNDLSPSRKLILMKLFQAPRPQQRFPLLLEISPLAKAGDQCILSEVARSSLRGEGSNKVNHWVWCMLEVD